LGDQIEEKLDLYNATKIVSNNNGRCRKSVLRSSVSSFNINEGQSKTKKTGQRSSISAISIKNIDGKPIKHDYK
jgi:hypothetical protein